MIESHECGCVAVVGAIAALLCAVPASAAELEYEVRGGLAYSDNVERAATDEIETSALVAGLRARGGRDEGRLQFSIDGDMAYYEYLDSDVEGEVAGGFAASSFYDIIPESFRWDLDASFAQIRDNLLRPSGPGNRDDVLIFSTGPTVQARFGDSLQAQLESRFTRADYSERDFDSDTIGGRLVLGRELSARSLIGLGASFDDVTYDAQLGGGSIDFDRREVFLRFRAEGARSTLEVDAGHAEVSGQNVDDSGLVARIEATRRLTPFISGYASYVQEYPTSEAASFVPADRLGGGAAEDGSILTAAPRVAKSAEVGFRLDRPRTAAAISLAHRRETGLVLSDQDRSVDGVGVTVSRAITPRSRAGVFATYSQEEIGSTVLDVSELAFGAEVNLTFGRNLGLDLRIEKRERDGDRAGDEYSELSAGLFLRWGRISGATGGVSVTPTAYLPR